MDRRATVTAIVCFGFLLTASFSIAQQHEQVATRKVVNKVAPSYPSLALRMNITGSVKVEALVSTNGTVKSAEIRGGHPVLAQAALEAVRKWKWEPASHETREAIEVTFRPQ